MDSLSCLSCPSCLDIELPPSLMLMHMISDLLFSCVPISLGYYASTQSATMSAGMPGKTLEQHSGMLGKTLGQNIGISRGTQGMHCSQLCYVGAGEFSFPA